jgi:DNA adenine methylase
MNGQIQPFLKWAGGKRQLIPEILKYIPKHFDKYYEPFLGAGAVFFAVKPNKAILNDINIELINVFEVIKDQVKELIIDLKSHEISKDYYYKIRKLDRQPDYKSLSNVNKASRIIYLNKTCYNGLFRVSKNNFFNVPYGRYKNPNIYDENNLKLIGKYLNESSITFFSTDFEKVLEATTKRDFVYLDPPYYPISNSSSFTSYSLNGFNKDEQKRLKKVCDELNKINCKFLLSNSATPFILNLYKEYKIEIVKANRSINSKASNRGKINEVLVRNYD